MISEINTQIAKEQSKKIANYIYILLAVFTFISIFCLYYNKTIFEIFLSSMPNSHLINFISYKVISPLWLPLKLSFWCALFITIPIACIFLWWFIKPALYPHERAAFRLIVFASMALFCIGVAFAFYIVLPALIYMIYNYQQTQFTYLVDIDNYLSFVVTTLMLFGICFQLPIALKALAKLNIVNASTLRNNRKSIFISAFIIGMLLTPPDVISQIMLAIPLYLLFEIGIYWL